MGNINGNQLDLYNQQQQVPKQIVSPFVKGKNSNRYQYESVLAQWLQQRQTQNDEISDEQQMNLLEKEKNSIQRNLFEEINFLEEQFNVEVAERIREHFDVYSFENKMGKKKCLEYFGLMDLQELEMGNEFFKAVKNVYPKSFSGPYLNYSKFLKTIYMLSQENHRGRMDFIFEFFDIKQNNNLYQEDIEQILEMFMELFMQVDFCRDSNFLELKQQVQKVHERDRDRAFKRVIQDIMQFQDPEANAIKQQGFQNWIYSMDGFEELFKFNPHDLYYE